MADTNQHNLTVTDEEAAVLEQIRLRQGLSDLNAAASWLIKSRLARTMRMTSLSKRGRALYLVKKQAGEQA